VGLFCISDFGLAGLEDAQFVTNLVLNEPLPLWGNYLALIGGSLAVLAFTVGLVNWRQLITVHES
jgi:hypothetical protein